MQVHGEQCAITRQALSHDLLLAQAGHWPRGLWQSCTSVVSVQVL